MVKNYDRPQRKRVSGIRRSLTNVGSVASSVNNLRPGCMLPHLAAKNVRNERGDGDSGCTMLHYFISVKQTNCNNGIIALIVFLKLLCCANQARSETSQHRMKVCCLNKSVKCSGGRMILLLCR